MTPRLLAAIYVASIEELTGDDYSEAQQEAWAATVDDEVAFGKRLASQPHADCDAGRRAGRLCIAEGANHIDLLYVHPNARPAGCGIAADRCDREACRRTRRQAADRRCQRHRRAPSSRNAAISRHSATASPSTTSGSPTPRCRRRWAKPGRRNRMRRRGGGGP